MVGIVDDEAATGQPIVVQEHAHTRHQAFVPGKLAVAKHPRQSRQCRGPETRAGNTCPANGVGHQHGGDATRAPRTLHSGHAVAWTMLAERFVTRLDNSASEGCRRVNEHGDPDG